MATSVTTRMLALFALFAVAAGPAVAQEPLSASDPAVRPYIGAWTLSADIQGNPVEFGLAIMDKDGKVEAALSSVFQPEPQQITNIAMVDGGLKMTYDADMGGNAVTINLEAKLQGDKLTGKFGDTNNMFTANFEGTKADATAAAAGPATFPKSEASSLDVKGLEEWIGQWKLSANMQGQQVTMLLELLDIEGKMGAIFVSPMLPTAEIINDISTTEGGLHLGFALSFGPQSFLVALEPKLADGKLTGKFGDSNNLFSAEFTGEKDPAVPSLVARLTPSGGEAGEGGRRRGRRGGAAEARVAFGSEAVRARFGGLSYSSTDKQLFEQTQDGEVFKFTTAAAVRFYTDADLRFGDTVIKAHNFDPGFPGLYSIWLKKEGDGWRLVFNEQGDAWGSMHDSAYDRAEIPLTYAAAEGDAKDQYTVQLEKSGDKEGILRILWGNHVWTATFALGS